MKTVRAFMHYDAAAKVWGVDLPTFTMLPNSHQPVTANLIHGDGVFPFPAGSTPAQQAAHVAAVLALNPSVDVIVPDEDTNPQTGKPSPAAIRLRYRNHAKFGRVTYAVPVTLSAAEIAQESALDVFLTKADTVATVGGTIVT